MQLFVNALKKEAEKKGMNMEVHAIGTNEVEEEVKKEWLGRCLMVAPQVRHRFDSVKKFTEEEAYPCGIIPPQAYIHFSWWTDFIKRL